MTKEQMILKMLEQINWPEQKKQRKVKNAVEKNSKSRIEEVYNYWTKNQNESLFCIMIL